KGVTLRAVCASEFFGRRQVRRVAAANDSSGRPFGKGLSRRVSRVALLQVGDPHIETGAAQGSERGYTDDYHVACTTLRQDGGTRRSYFFSRRERTAQQLSLVWKFT